MSKETPTMIPEPSEPEAPFDPSEPEAPFDPSEPEASFEPSEPETSTEVVEVPEETVDGVPVLAEAHAIEPPAAALPAVQAVAVAATGFVAGAATIALVKRHSARKVARATARTGARRAVDLLPIVGTRTFLVDVHLIAKPQE